MVIMVMRMAERASTQALFDEVLDFRIFVMFRYVFTTGMNSIVISMLWTHISTTAVPTSSSRGMLEVRFGTVVLVQRARQNLGVPEFLYDMSVEYTMYVHCSTP